MSMVSQLMHLPDPTHFKAVYKILKYLKRSPRKGLLLEKHSHLQIEVYTEAD